MENIVWRLWREDDGVLSFEWILLATLVTVGVVGGIATVRDATLGEFGDLAQAISSIDQSFTINDPLAFSIGGSISGGAGNSSFVDDTQFQVVRRPSPIVRQVSSPGLR